MRKTMLRNCMIFGLMMVLIGIPNTAAEEQQEYDATVSFRFYADEDHGYEVKVQSFQVPDNWPENEPFKVQVEFDYHIGLDEADNILYDVWWGGHILLQGGGKLQPPDWHHIAYVNPYEWEPGVGDKETFYKTFKGLSGPCYFEAYCWMIYYVYVWDDIHQEWDYWKSDDPHDRKNSTINFPVNDPYLEADASILMADETTKNIKDVRVNDYVMAYDFMNNCTIATKVTEVYNDLYNDSGELNNYLLINNKLAVTPETRIHVNNIWIYAQSASIGDYRTTPTVTPEQITSIEEKFSIDKKYGFKVENYSSFFAENFLIQTNVYT